MRTVYLLIAFILLGIVIFILQKFTGKKAEKPQPSASKTQQPEVQPADPLANGECCGAHEICEKTGKYNPQFKPDYYEDEELDAYKGMSPDDYTEEQIAEFEEVLMTMKESDVAGWLKSLSLRGIELPYPVREKALIILG